MIDWFSLLTVLGFVSLLMVVYALITWSAGIYQTARQFWAALLASTGIAFLLSGTLFLLAHLPIAAAVIASAVVPFLVGSVVSKGDIYSEERAAPEELEAGEDAQVSEAAAGLPEEFSANHRHFLDPAE